MKFAKVPPPPKRRRLPDLKMIIWLHLTRLRSFFATKQYEKCYEELDYINSLLPPDYRVKIKPVALKDISKQVQNFRDDNRDKKE